jgi:hypothetical protein
MSEDSTQDNLKDRAGNSTNPKPEQKGDALPLPDVDFTTFLLSLASSALVQFGDVPNPENGSKEENLPLAKHTIDVICMLQDKIKNGLTDAENKLLTDILYELRLKYVIKSKS